MVQKTEDWQTFNQVFNHHCDCDLEHSNLIFSQDTPAYDDALSNKSGCKGICNRSFLLYLQSWRYSRNDHMLILWAFTVTLTTAKQSFCKTLWFTYINTRWKVIMSCLILALLSSLPPQMLQQSLLSSLLWKHISSACMILTQLYLIWCVCVCSFVCVTQCVCLIFVHLH